ncbi:PepSY-like domain-containing protein [Jejudonia soesokkakensis]|uniref:PepSY-like domain-containing protein n=1 Tax=Jejudonia soesokkakensis TaxID=1323432 RepID=A0ABW2MSY7_9FLAO
MKNIGVILVMLCTVAISSCQENSNHKNDSEKTTVSEVPKAVQKAFVEKYPGENDPDWAIDAHGNWESHFKIDGEKYRADYASDGSWIETENSIKKENLPDAIKTAIKKNYGDLKITEVEHVTSATKGEFYDVEFKQKGKNKDVEFRADGSELN